MGRIRKTKDGYSIRYSGTHDAVGTLNQRISTLEKKLLNRDKMIIEKKQKMINLSQQIARINKEIQELEFPQSIELELKQMKDWLKEFEEELENES